MKKVFLRAPGKGNMWYSLYDDSNAVNEDELTVTLSLSQGLSILLPPSNSKSTKSILTMINDKGDRDSF